MWLSAKKSNAKSHRWLSFAPLLRMSKLVTDVFCLREKNHWKFAQCDWSDVFRAMFSRNTCWRSAQTLHSVIGPVFWHLGALPTQRATWKSRVHYYPLWGNVRGSEKSAGGELICHFSYHQVACIRTQSHYSTRWVFTSESILSAYAISAKSHTITLNLSLQIV